MITTMNNTKT